MRAVPFMISVYWSGVGCQVCTEGASSARRSIAGCTVRVSSAPSWRWIKSIFINAEISGAAVVTTWPLFSGFHISVRLVSAGTTWAVSYIRTAWSKVMPGPNLPLTCASG
ncbi:MAG: hypothetical protein BGP12_01925 [Rhodospirillales bacterium 70-18]|nr:MAG: hypothetical protein BGP12_01925 [Rhodospirillales bacterium 70-18]